ncbi:unnamed protein product [Rotaria sp. Silwood1]|nr:unnamed protein product [Rotaria sp. Silwood1]
MATTTSTGKAKCFKCDKDKVVYLCEGCSQKFCLTDLTEHHKNHGIELDKIITDCDAFQQKLIEQQVDQNQRVLIQQIDEWEKDSINKIKQTAEECRQISIKFTVDNIVVIEKELNKLIIDWRQIRQEDDFNEFHLDQLKKELEKLQKELNQVSNISIQEHPTSFINKISICGVNSNIPVDAKWAQSGMTVAGGHGAGDAINQLDGPFGIFVDNDQTIVIADTWNHRIIQLKIGDANGQVIAGGHASGNRLDQLNYPTDVLVDKEMNSLIICDWQNRRVVRWSRRSDTTQGEILIDNIRCFGLALDNQRYLYVSDTDKHVVRRYKLGDKNGTIVAGGHGKGDGLNQLNYPTFVFVDQQQAVYVSDNENHRVMKWNNGTKEGIVVAGGHGQGKALTQLSNPNGLFVDSLGTIYVTDLGNDRVMRWPRESNQGTVIVGGIDEGQGANQLNSPEGDNTEESFKELLAANNNRLKSISFDHDSVGFIVTTTSNDQAVSYPNIEELIVNLETDKSLGHLFILIPHINRLHINFNELSFASKSTLTNVSSLVYLKDFELRSINTYWSLDEIAYILSKMPFLQRLALYLRTEDEHLVNGQNFIQNLPSSLVEIHLFIIY